MGIKRKERGEGCKFCNDDDFARLHMMEDLQLNTIAELAAEAVANDKGMSERYRLLLRDALTRFRELDSDYEREKRVVRQLQEIERDLG